MAATLFQPVLDIAMFAIQDEGNSAMFHYKGQDGLYDVDLTSVYRDGDDYFVTTDAGDTIQILPQDPELFQRATERAQQFFCEIDSEGDILRCYAGAFLNSAPAQVPGV